MSTRRIQLNPYLQHLRELDFVRAVEFSPEFKIGDRMSGGILSIGSANGAFRFIVEQKNTYLDRGMINAVIAQAKAYEAARSGKRHSPLLLFARYVPRPSAERLLESGVNFLDLAGNMHIVLGSSYERTIIGRREPEAAEQTRTITAAKTQLLFTFAGFPEASRWTVRQLAERAGVSKSNAAKLRKQLVDEGILTRDLRIRNNEDLDGLLLRAYEQALRPKLLINRFRAPANSAEAVIKEMGDVFDRSSTRWSLTGG
ncbi:MAG: helix-turn-helix domain-containing protein, partial [Blastocatellia bacterium]